MFDLIFRKRREFSAISIFFLLAGCAAVGGYHLNNLYGEPDNSRFDNPIVTVQSNFDSEIQPLLDKRCVVCHGCYDAPCQLKLNSWQGLSRGANKTMVYDGGRLLAGNLTRLFEDADTNAQWRDKNFHPVLNERTSSPAANVEGSVLAQMLLLKQQHPLPQGDKLPDSFDLDISRKQECPKIETFASYASSKPLWGMPYALPGLASAEQTALLDWIAAGSPINPPLPVAEDEQKEIDRWEQFFNQPSLKAQLTARYMYEHLYLAHLYFGELTQDNEQPRFFQLVRSATPPGEPLERISGRRPYDDPGVDRVYYRLIPVPYSVLVKTHMPYRLDAGRLQRWTELFLEANYTVTSLPGWESHIASNPFLVFHQLPVKARYRFMLEEAEYTIMGFIKGPVCRGQVALNVINDHSWAVFVDPDVFDIETDSDFLAKVRKEIRLPAEDESSAGLFSWLKYSKSEEQYLKTKTQALSKLTQRFPIDTNLIWDGDGDNKNASLTILRHFDSATVVKGLYGEKPQTAWLIGYTLLERIHYLLVAGFDVYGDAGHQLSSRLYMDFLRMEGEYNFLALLPKDKRLEVRDFWYRGATKEVQDYLFGRYSNLAVDTAIAFKTDEPLAELYQMVQDRLGPALDKQLSMEVAQSPAEKTLQRIDSLSGVAVSWLPQLAFITLESEDGTLSHYTLIHHDAHTNIAHLLGEAKRRLPQEDTVTILRGFVGAYPNTLFKLQASQAEEFVRQISTLSSEEDYANFAANFAIRRTNPRFWQHSDLIHQAAMSSDFLRGGIFDYNRLENR